MYFKDWARNGIITISDLYNENGAIMSVNELNDIIKKPGGVMLEYHALLPVIPRNWKELKRLNKHDYKEGLKHGSKFYQLDNCTSKLIRSILVSNLSVKHICEGFWEKKFRNYNFTWTNIWDNVPNITKEARLITLNWKILSNIYQTNILLPKIGKANSTKCETCKVEVYLEHFFFHCKKVKPLWDEINIIIFNKTNKQISLSVTECLFGYFKGCKEDIQLINKLIIIGKLCISKYKYGNYPNLIVLLKHETQLRCIR